MALNLKITDTTNGQSANNSGNINAVQGDAIVINITGGAILGHVIIQQSASPNGPWENTSTVGLDLFGNVTVNVTAGPPQPGFQPGNPQYFRAISA